MDTSRIGYYHKLYKSALVFNLAVSISFILAFEAIYMLVGGTQVPQHPLIPLFVVLTGFATALFGFVYYLVGRRYECSDSDAFILFCAIAKVLFFFIFLGFVLFADIPWPMISVSMVDFFYGLLFWESLTYKRKNPQFFNLEET